MDDEECEIEVPTADDNWDSILNTNHNIVNDEGDDE